MENDAEVQVEGCITHDGKRICGDNLSVTSLDTAAPVSADTELAVIDSPSLFAWAQPILDDPLGWAQANLLNTDVLMPYLWQLAAIIGALFVGILLTGQVRSWVWSGLARLPENLRALVEDTVPKLVRPALWAALLYGAQAAMAGAGPTNMNCTSILLLVQVHARRVVVVVRYDI